MLHRNLSASVAKRRLKHSCFARKRLAFKLRNVLNVILPIRNNDRRNDRQSGLLNTIDIEFKQQLPFPYLRTRFHMCRESFAF